MARIVSSHNCYVIHKDRVIMLHRSENVPRFPGFWMGPGGRQEPFEDILHSSANHVKEESGVAICNVRLRVVATHHYPAKDEMYLVFIFLADFAGGELKPYSRGEIAWVERNKLLELETLYPDLRVHLPLVFDDSGELYFTHIEYDAEYRLRKVFVRTSKGVILRR